MIKEITKTESIDDIEFILNEDNEDDYFCTEELKSVQTKNKIKSLGARYLIKKSILEFLELEGNYQDIKITNENSGKPIISFDRKVKDKLADNNIHKVFISISHSKNYISTLVVLEKDV